MADSADYLSAMAKIAEEWNKAEKAIKLAEQVNGEIINPAIYELRYSGRRIIEAFEMREKAPDDAIKRLHDAHFDCCRARHDAIDAATSKIAADLDIATDKIGADIVIASFPDMPSLIADLGEVRDKIAVSREKRDDRDAIYASIQNDDLVSLVKLFQKFKASEPLMKAAAVKARKRQTKNDIFGYGGFAVGIAAFLFSIFVWVFGT
jgi:uncharacterized protein YdcH (DUF465 family)